MKKCDILAFPHRHGSSVSAIVTIKPGLEIALLQKTGRLLGKPETKFIMVNQCGRRSGFLAAAIQLRGSVSDSTLNMGCKTAGNLT